MVVFVCKRSIRSCEALRLVFLPLSRRKGE